MPFTQRFVLLLFGVPVLVALSLWLPVLSVLALVYALVLVTLLIIDLRSLPAKKSVSISRSISPKLGIGATKDYFLEIKNRSSVGRLDEIVDALPPDMDLVETESHDDGSHRIRLRALKRGEFQIGPAFLRFVGALGLAERRMTFPETASVRVIPQTPGLTDQRMRRGLIREAGNRLMRLAGRGDEFESLRVYQADDDPRHIDWRSTARRGKLLTKSYQPESKQRVMIGLDLGRTMLGRSGDISKTDMVLNHCLLMAHTALAEGDSVGFIAFSDRMLARMPVSSGKRQIHNLLENAADLDAEAVETDYRILLRELSVWERKRTLLVLFTDFIDETQTEELRATLMTLGRRHRLLIVAVRDPELYELAKQPADSADEAFAISAAAHLTMHRNVAVRALRQGGVTVADLEHEELAKGIVERYLRMREAAIF